MSPGVASAGQGFIYVHLQNQQTQEGEYNDGEDLHLGCGFHRF